MADDNPISERAAMIMREALKRPAANPADGRNYQLIAQISDGTLKIDKIGDDDLNRLIDSFGIEQVADAVMETVEDPLEEDVRPATASRSWWVRPRLLALAASFAVIFTGAVVLLLHARRGTIDVDQLAINWTSADAVANPNAPSWGSPDFNAAKGAPDFNIVSRDINDAGPDLMRLREATAIVQTDAGTGSGVVIDPRGYVLTNYHVIADAAQKAAAAGKVAVVQVILPHLVHDQLKPAPAVLARVFRADAEHDLALLKLDSFPADEISPAPFVPLADAVTDNEACTVIGSEFNGPAWWPQKCTISGRFDFPEGLSAAAVGMAAPSLAERTRVTLLVTNAQISPGDSGGPLLNSKGELIGLTLANGAKQNAGAGGWHIALRHLHAFLKSIPDQPEGVPFDLWSAGLPEATLQQPESKDSTGTGHPDILRVRYLTQSDTDANPQQVADVNYFDSSGRNTASTPPAADALIPAGLWGMGNRGSFQFELCIVRRSDGVIAVGYANEARVLAEIRIATAGNSRAEVVWKKSADGQWHPAADAAGKPVLDMAAIHAADARRIAALLKKTFHRDKN
jgi:S1-C subfamily serine protease